MSTITLPNIRVSSDLTVSVRLKDNGVAIDWSTLNNVKASIYSDAQRALAGRCDVSVDAEDPTVLVCQYAANKPQYVGVCRIVVSAKYMGETKTYDKPAFNFVRWTADQDGEQITIDDPDVDVEIEVSDVSSSLLDEAIRAAFTAAEEAVDAKGQVLETEAEVEAAEALRVSAEESRVEAEEGRAEAEAARVDEEAVRVSAEDARVVAENARAAAEDLREGAEDDRAAAETARETAEAARVAAEALRVTAEGSRETAEAAREAQASADHTVAAGDHTQAAADHTQAAADHTTAASDHTQAGADHTLAAADHVTAGEDHVQAQDDHEVMEGYDTRLGSVESEVSQLEAEVHNLSGKYYGVHASSATLPDDADAPGYAFVGSANPYAIWNFDGATWSDSGSVANGISGEPGVGLDDVTTPTPADGTVVMHLSNGNTVTLNLNHNHPQYAKVVMCEDLTEYNAISPKDNMTIYLIPQVAMYLGSTLMLEQNSAPLPYTPVDYIETDGDAYIDTGIIGAPVKSAEMKVLPAGGASYTILGSRGSTNDGEAKKFQMFRIIYYSADSIYVVGYGYYYSVAGASNPSVTDSVTNETPFIVKGSFKNGAQRVSVKEEGESSFRSNSTTYTKTITSSLNMYIFAANENGTAGNKATSGTRVYYCKIYSDDSYSTLLFNGVPCYYNNEYGLWDKVSNTFFGAVSGSGTITGPSIS